MQHFQPQTLHLTKIIILIVVISQELIALNQNDDENASNRHEYDAYLLDWLILMKFHLMWMFALSSEPSCVTDRNALSNVDECSRFIRFKTHDVSDDNDEAVSHAMRHIASLYHNT